MGRDESEPCQSQHDTSRAIQRLPILVHEHGRPLQCIWDGRRLGKVDLNGHIFGESGLYNPAVWLNDSFGRLGRALHDTFVPEHVRPQYIHYMNWKCLHRVFSSVLQVQCTQAMLRAIGIGAKRALPSAAAMNWVLKDGLGRLGKLTYTASLGRTFDSDLKRVRFSTSVLFSLSLGVEMLTQHFPRHFLLMATLANVGKSISYAAYVATSVLSRPALSFLVDVCTLVIQALNKRTTGALFGALDSSAIHRSFALADNLSDISAKGQVQSVVCDNLGLAIAVGLNRYYRPNSRVEKFLPLLSFPILAAADLFAIYHELRSVHFRTLNKERLELIVDRWLNDGVVPSIEEVSNEETLFLVRSSKTGNRQLPLKIGALNLKRWQADDLLRVVHSHEKQCYILCQEDHDRVSWMGRLGGLEPGLSLWLHDEAVTKDIITGVLQVCYIRKAGSVASSRLVHSGSAETMHRNANRDKKDLRSKVLPSDWQTLFERSTIYAHANIDTLLTEIEAQGWQSRHIILSPSERTTYSILKS